MFALLIALATLGSLSVNLASYNAVGSSYLHYEHHCENYDGPRESCPFQVESENGHDFSTSQETILSVGVTKSIYEFLENEPK